MRALTLAGFALIGGCIGAPADTGETGEPYVSGPVVCTLLAPSIREGQLALIDVQMETGVWQEAVRFNAGVDSGAHTNGLARLGDSFVASVYDVGYVEFNASSRRATVHGPQSGGPPGSVASDGQALYTEDGTSDVGVYSDISSLVAGTPARVLSRPFYASRYAAADGELFGAWHSTSEVSVADSATGAFLRNLSLEDWDTWVQGMSVVGDVLYLVDDDRRDNYEGEGVRIAAYDKHSGALLDNVFLGDIEQTGGYRHRPSGLWCEPR